MSKINLKTVVLFGIEELIQKGYLERKLVNQKPVGFLLTPKAKQVFIEPELGLERLESYPQFTVIQLMKCLVDIGEKKLARMTQSSRDQT